MQIPVLVEPIENQGFRASGGPAAPGIASPKRATPDREASAGFRLLEIEPHRIAAGAILVNLEVGTTEENPWVQCTWRSAQGRPIL